MIILDSTAQLISEVESRLRPFGATSTQFLTGSVAGPTPFGSTVDLLFQPARGPHQGEMFVVEVKQVRSQFMPDVTAWGAVRALAEVRKVNSLELRTAFATNAQLFPVGRQACVENAVEVMEAVADPEDLAKRILRWAGVADLRRP